MTASCESDVNVDVPPCLAKPSVAAGKTWAALLAACWLAACAAPGPGPGTTSTTSRDDDGASAPVGEDDGAAGRTPDGRAPGAEYKVGQPYEVAGVTYTPEVDYSYDETGIASWYGREFHGGETANGEIYDMTALTAAHKTLPLPSIVRVTNLENGRRIRVRVNDRGPFKKGRIIDLSRRAADLLGMQSTGTARVRVQIDAEASRELHRALQEGRQPDLRTASLTPPDTTSAATSGSDGQSAADGAAGTTSDDMAGEGTAGAGTGGAGAGEPAGASESAAVEQVSPRDTTLFIQVGAFLERANATELARDLSELGSVKVSRTTHDGRRFHRVRLGPLATVDAADARLAQIKAAGYDQARLVVDW